jgi:hypothetical protein
VAEGVPQERQLAWDLGIIFSGKGHIKESTREFRGVSGSTREYHKPSNHKGIRILRMTKFVIR